MIGLAVVALGGFFVVRWLSDYQDMQMGLNCKEGTQFSFWGATDVSPSEARLEGLTPTYVNPRLNGEESNSMLEPTPNLGCWIGLDDGDQVLTYEFEGEEISVTLRLTGERGYVGSKDGLVVPDPGGSVEIVSTEGAPYERRRAATEQFLAEGQAQ